MAHSTRCVCVCVCCSAGCGRTGVICALDYIHDLLVTKVTRVNTSDVSENMSQFVFAWVVFGVCVCE